MYYINNNVATISRNSGQEIYCPLPPQELVEKYMNLDSKFYTIDYVELSDGSWIIIEAGNGDVSGLSEKQDFKALYRTLSACFQ